MNCILFIVHFFLKREFEKLEFTFRDGFDTKKKETRKIDQIFETCTNVKYGIQVREMVE